MMAEYACCAAYGRGRKMLGELINQVTLRSGFGNSRRAFARGKVGGATWLRDLAAMDISNVGASTLRRPVLGTRCLCAIRALEKKVTDDWTSGSDHQLLGARGSRLLVLSGTLEEVHW